jgi:flagellar basal body-associated protein FliL
MNESQQPNQSQKESLKLVLIVSGFYSLVALGIILKLLGLF